MGKILEYQNIICTEITIIDFNYSISKEGVAFCESLNDKYVEDFIEIVKKANVLFLDYSDRKLTHCINKYAIAMLRGEKS